MSRRQAVLATVLLAVVAVALIGFGTATVIDSLSRDAVHHTVGSGARR